MDWLPGLLTEIPEEGFQLAIKLSRMAVKFTQPDGEVRSRLRKDHEKKMPTVSPWPLRSWASISRR